MSKKEEQELEAFDAKIEQTREKLSDKPASNMRFATGWGLGIRLATELLGGVVVGAGIGLLFDKLFSTPPLFLIIFLFFGSAAGILNVYRVANQSTEGKNKEV